MAKLIFGDTSARNVLVQMVDDHDLSVIENEVSLIREFAGVDFFLIAIKVNSWNHDLSPWDAPVVFGDESFGNGAADTLKVILDELGEIDHNKKYFIGGYSLAGLFALWSVYQTEIFSGAAAVSPSIWFPGFRNYMEGHEILTKAVYLSRGDREERTRNPIMSTVGDRIREAYETLNGSGVDCMLEWNKGNHFKEPDLRTAKAFAWVMSRTKALGDSMKRMDGRQFGKKYKK